MKKTIKKMKKDFEKEINIIAKKIEPRIQDVCSKFERDVANEATMYAFWIGMHEDLNSALNVIEKRNEKAARDMKPEPKFSGRCFR